jgi:hypothetical protein
VKIGAAILAVFAIASSTSATAADVAGAFGQGRFGFVVGGGTGYAFNQTYFVLGVGATYYIVNGLNVGLSVESWSGADPHITKVTPSVQYVFYQVPVVKPYIGAFFRRAYMSSLPDVDSVGGRAGLYVQVGRNAYIGGGVAYEAYINCNQTIYSSCTNTYPELSFTLAF